MTFSDEDLEKLRMGHLAVSGKRQRLVERYVVRTYKNSRAQEYAKHGFCRRLGTLARCVDRVFEILPPDRIDLPTSDELTDAAINIQAFVFNVFGSADNLAWIWVKEKSLAKDDGSKIPDVWVGLRKCNKFVRGSFSSGFQEYLTGLNDWFDYLENFRHALAHRIPLYVPPYVVANSRVAAFQEFEDQMTEASNRQDFAEYERLSVEQEALVGFQPSMTHSFEDEAKHVVFHAQMLADFNTIEELGQKILDELAH